VAGATPLGQSTRLRLDPHPLYPGRSGGKLPGVPATRSAGVLLYRFATEGDVEVLIGHMGGPFWARKDAGGWSIPKGEHGPGEEPLAVARREFAEELGSPVPARDLLDLGELRVTSGKLLTVFAGEGDLDAAGARSNTFDLEWPPRSGRVHQFPEVDRVGWFLIEEARAKLVKGQVPFLDRLLARLAAPA
jgi:predicted NUDIX family NTP pyrophosphohydrolase